jgi:cytochrome c peroxidase
MTRKLCLLTGAGALLAACAWLRADAPPPSKNNPHPEPNPAADYEWQLPDESLMTPFKDRKPILFVNRSQNLKEWEALPAFWNPGTEKAVEPRTGRAVERECVRVKVPLGLTQNPPVPAENPVTVAKWALGKQLYYDRILSSDGRVACASCHDPKKGFTDRSPFSTGIKNLKGGMSAPTVFNTAYQPFQFWDGRASSLEDQSQGPVMNPVEMFSGDGHAWNAVVRRVRARPDYVRQFAAVFGTPPTRDSIAKAIATYERTVLSGNSVHDRAEVAMRKRVEEEETGKFELSAKDYEAVLKAAFAAKDANALESLGLDPAKDAARAPETAKAIDRGRAVFFGKARCNSCHAGDNFTDYQFHNLGVGVKDGQVPPGRYGALPTGAKDPALVGAFKTPTLRHLLGTAPYMHDGSEDTLAKVVDFYDKGGNANEYLDNKMRDYEAEKEYLLSAGNHTRYKGPPVALLGKSKTPVVPLKLNLTKEEKQDLVLFLRALQGDPADSIVADPEKAVSLK